METRICGHCGIEKPLEDFHRNRAKPLGRAYWCKDCALKHDRQRNRIRDKTPERILKSKQWLHSEKGKALYRRRYAENKDAIRAQKKIRNLIKTGVITKQPCKTCGDKEGNAHHPDYSKPLDVVWLCQAHHSEIHRK